MGWQSGKRGRALQARKRRETRGVFLLLNMYAFKIELRRAQAKPRAPKPHLRATSQYPLRGIIPLRCGMGVHLEPVLWCVFGQSPVALAVSDCCGPFGPCGVS